mgnify:CR=1 FL=1
MKILSLSLALLGILTACECPRGKRCNVSGYDARSTNRAYLLTSNNLSETGQYMDADGRILVQDRAFYGYDSYSLDSANRAALKTQSQWLRDNPEINITIVGHCDERGTREYNIGLGERRANTVKRYLVSQGISSHRMNVVSKGKDDPVVFGSNEAAWAQNRVAIVIPQ